jgi:hypothetical protein
MYGIVENNFADVFGRLAVKMKTSFCIDCGCYLRPDQGIVTEEGIVCDECYKYRCVDNGNEHDEEHKEI